jgi:hypothetical protein
MLAPLNSFVAITSNAGPLRMVYRSIALKSDAARYDVAMRTIAGVTSMRLANPQELKAALAIIKEQLKHLKLHRSKLVNFVLNDYTFTTALKEACPNQRAAEALMRELRANPKTVFNLRRVHLLSMRLVESIRADTTMLRRIAQRLREATAPSGFPPKPDPTAQIFYDQDWLGIVMIMETIIYMEWLLAFGSLFDFQAGLSADLISCQDVAYRKYFACLSLAQSLPELEKDKLSARCASEALEQIAECWRPGMSRRLPWDSLPNFK